MRTRKSLNGAYSTLGRMCCQFWSTQVYRFASGRPFFRVAITSGDGAAWMLVCPEMNAACAAPASGIMSWSTLSKYGSFARNSE